MRPASQRVSNWSTRLHNIVVKRKGELRLPFFFLAGTVVSEWHGARLKRLRVHPLVFSNVRRTCHVKTQAARKLLRQRSVIPCPGNIFGSDSSHCFRKRTT